jgi:phage major head subunit gpT-like protein
MPANNLIVTNTTIDAINTGFNAKFMEGVSTASEQYKEFSMIINSNTDGENLGWIRRIPNIRQWLTGDRLLQHARIDSFYLENLRYESTLEIQGTEFDDDKLSKYTTIMAMMGADAGNHINKLVYGALAAGSSTTCVDGQFFFDTDHLGFTSTGSETTYSNKFVVDALKPGWVLLDNSNPFTKAVAWINRTPPMMKMPAGRFDDRGNFMADTMVYGSYLRGVARAVLPQLASVTFGDLTSENFESAKVAMQSIRSPDGKFANINPSIIIVPPSLEAEAKVLFGQTLANGASNPWFNAVKVIVSPYMADLVV